MDTLPHNLYTSTSVAIFDKLAIESGLPGYSLMRRAGKALLELIDTCYPDARRILIVCGAGNNAGDGYVLARLAQQQGRAVELVSLVEPEQLAPVAAQACAHWQEVGSVQGVDALEFDNIDLVVDALLGIGLARDVDGRWAEVIAQINAAAVPVLAVDIPSGLDANTGCVRGAAVKAQRTLCFIALKLGLFTADAREHCGEVHFAGLDVAAEVYDARPVAARLIDAGLARLTPRPHNSHKAQFGHVLMIGGNYGMAGAIAMAASAALVCGAGLVTVLTRPEHVATVTTLCPEAMVVGSEVGDIPSQLGDVCTHVLIGCGLGSDGWSQHLLLQVKQMDLPVIYDADALNLISTEIGPLENAVMLTPHPGEAARLLETDTASVQADRYAAVKALAARFDSVAILKGSGSLVCDGEHTHVCAQGTAAMASAGMGDVLAGMVTALLAQGLEPLIAGSAAVYLHARAAEQHAAGRTRGLLATDVLRSLPTLLT